MSTRSAERVHEENINNKGMAALLEAIKIQWFRSPAREDKENI
jgi:hypothetical protein